jgi:hypothetical protein
VVGCTFAGSKCNVGISVDAPINGLTIQGNTVAGAPATGIDLNGQNGAL